MATISLYEALLPQFVLRVASRIFDGQGPLGTWAGFQTNKFDPETGGLAGPRTVTGGPRFAMFRYMDSTRVVSFARAPGTGPVQIARNPVGVQQVACLRSHEKIPLNYEELGNISTVAGPNTQLDQGGQDYIGRQIKHLHKRLNNFVELITAGMFLDNLYMLMSGDTWYPQIGAPSSGTYFQVPYRIPSGQKTQLNALGTGNILTVPWNNIGAPIVTNLLQVVAAFMQVSGYSLTDIWMNSLMWNNLILNTQVREVAGTAATPYAEFERTEAGKNNGGEPNGEFRAILKAIPTITFHISDFITITNVDVDPVYSTAPTGAVYQKSIPDNYAIFVTRPNDDIYQMYHGSEWIVERPGAAATLKKGIAYWNETTTQPSMNDLITLGNCLPVLFNYLTIWPATVVF